MFPLKNFISKISLAILTPLTLHYKTKPNYYELPGCLRKAAKCLEWIAACHQGTFCLAVKTYVLKYPINVNECVSIEYYLSFRI